MFSRAFIALVTVACSTLPSAAQSDPDYDRMHKACMAEFKALGPTPLEITKRSAKNGLEGLRKVVQSNLGKTSWSTTANEPAIQGLARIFRAFTICDIDGSLEFLPGLEDIPEAPKLAKSVSEALDWELRNIGQRVF